MRYIVEVGAKSAQAELQALCENMGLLLSPVGDPMSREEIVPSVERRRIFDEGVTYVVVFSIVIDSRTLCLGEQRDEYRLFEEEPGLIGGDPVLSRSYDRTMLARVLAAFHASGTEEFVKL